MQGVVVREALASDAQAIAQVRIDSWRATYRGVIPDAYLEAMSIPENASLWNRILSAPRSAATIFVAEDASGVVGFAAANRLAERRFDLDAELTAIYLRADRKRLGVGLRLVAAAARGQIERGATGLLTWVIAANRPARAFYEALGAELLVEQPFQWDGIDLVEAGYGFRELAALAARALPSNSLH